MIIDLFRDSICFSYSQECKKSQMFFSSKVKTNDTVETLRKADPLKERANVLQTLFKEFDFCLDGSFNSAEDATLSQRSSTNLECIL